MKTFLSLLQVFRRTSMRSGKTSLHISFVELTCQVFLLQKFGSEERVRLYATVQRKKSAQAYQQGQERSAIEE